MPQLSGEDIALESSPDDKKRTTLSDHSIYLSPRKICLLLVYCMLGLLVAHISAIVIHDSFDKHITLRKMLLQHFSFDREGNFPTFFSALLLLISSLICFYISFSDKSEKLAKKSRYWYSLGFIFLFLCLDEAVQIHEQLMIVMDYLIPNRASIFSSAWTIPYFVIFSVVGLYFLRFLFSLPVPVRNLLLLSGAIFVSGAMGVEFLEGYVNLKYGSFHFFTHAVYTLQELMEMSGIILFIYTLLTYVSRHKKKVVLRFVS
jgi:hypothetical protein